MLQLFALVFLSTFCMASADDALCGLILHYKSRSPSIVELEKTLAQYKTVYLAGADSVSLLETRRTDLLTNEVAKYEEALQDLQREMAILPKKELDETHWDSSNCLPNLLQDPQLHAILRRALPQLTFFKKQHQRLVDMKFAFDKKIITDYYIDRLGVSYN